LNHPKKKKAEPSWLIPCKLTANSELLIVHVSLIFAKSKKCIKGLCATKAKHNAKLAMLVGLMRIMILFRFFQFYALFLPADREPWRCESRAGLSNYRAQLEAILRGHTQWRV